MTLMIAIPSQKIHPQIALENKKKYQEAMILLPNKRMDMLANMNNNLTPKRKMHSKAISISMIIAHLKKTIEETLERERML